MTLLPAILPREPPEVTAGAKVLVWLPSELVDRLVAARRPGEDYSATILRIAAEAATILSSADIRH